MSCLQEGRVRKLQNQFLYWAAAEAGSRAEVKIDEAARRMDLGLPCSGADLHGNASQVRSALALLCIQDVCSTPAPLRGASGE